MYIYIYINVNSSLYRCTSGKVEEPQTPSPRRTELIRKLGNSISAGARKITKDGNSGSVSIGKLQWGNRKPYRRIVRKRAEFQSLSPFFNVNIN